MFWDSPCVAHPSKYRWTCVMILSGSESDHYKCPICSLLQDEVGNVSWGNSGPGVSNVDRGAEWKENFLDQDSRWSLLLQSLSRSGVRNNTLWQGLKCVFHPALDRSSYHLSCSTIIEVGDTYLKCRHWEGNRLLWRWAFFKKGMAHLARRFEFLLLWQVYDLQWSDASSSFGIKSLGGWLLGFFLLYIRWDSSGGIWTACFKGLFCSATVCLLCLSFSGGSRWNG